MTIRQFIVFLIVVFSINCFADESSVVASLNGDAISLMDVMAESRAKELQLHASFSGQKLYDEILVERKRILDSIINRKLIVADYYKNPFEIPTQYVESLLDDRAELAGVRSRSDFASMIREAGMSLKEVEKMAKEDLIVQVMVARNIQVNLSLTPKEIYEYFEDNNEEFSREEQWKLSMIFIPFDTEAKDSLLKEIDQVLKDNPNRFMEMARYYSKGPNAQKGGDLGFIDRPAIRKEFADAIITPEVDKVYGWVKTEEGDYYLRITDFIPSENADFRGLENKIRTRLENKKRKEIYDEYVRKLREKAIIRHYL